MWDGISRWTQSDLANTKRNTTHIDQNPCLRSAIYQGPNQVRMAEIEHPERYSWWLNEL